MGTESVPMELDKCIKLATYKMKIIRETIVAGRTILRSLHPGVGKRTPGLKRKARENQTPEKVARVNYRNAVKKLTAILNHNFRDGDYHITLTYAEEADPQQAKERLEKFLRNVHDYCKRHDIPWKRVAVTEYENRRIHHHVVCSGIDREIIESRWKYGHVNFRELYSKGCYHELADYLVKETEKTFRRPDAVSRQRYNPSRNIVVPVPKIEEVSKAQLDRDPKPLKGYYIVSGTENRYEHEFYEMDCLEYIEATDAPVPRIRRWKGRPGKYEKLHRTTEDQLVWELEF